MGHGASGNSDDRPAALLTKAQREYLQGKKEYRPSVERDIRKRIRNRLHHGLKDISLIVDEMDTEDLRKAVVDDNTDIDEEERFPNSWGDNPPSDIVALAVLVKEFELEDMPRDQSTDKWSIEPETTIQSGVDKAFRKKGQSLETNEHKVERGNIFGDLIKEKLDKLSNDQLFQIHAAGLITANEYAKAMSRPERLRDDDDSFDTIATMLAHAFSESDTPSLMDVAEQGDIDVDQLQGVLLYWGDEIADRVAESDETDLSPVSFRLEHGEDIARIHPIE